MKKILFILLIGALFGQVEPNKQPSLMPGENYKYDLYVDFISLGPDLIKLGTATLSTEKIEVVNDKNAYHLKFSVKTSKVGDIIYKIRDVINIWIDTKTLTVLKQTKKLREGNLRREYVTIVNENKAITNGKEYMIPDNIYDPYALILMLKDEKIPVGESKKFKTIDSGKFREIEIMNIGSKTIRTPAGKFEATTYKPMNNGRSSLKNKGDIQVSYGEINDKVIPIKISLKLSRGVIVLKLKKSSDIVN